MDPRAQSHQTTTKAMSLKNFVRLLSVVYMLIPLFPILSNFLLKIANWREHNPCLHNGTTRTHMLAFRVKRLYCTKTPKSCDKSIKQIGMITCELHCPVRCEKCRRTTGLVCFRLFHVLGVDQGRLFHEPNA